MQDVKHVSRKEFHSSLVPVHIILLILSIDYARDEGPGWNHWGMAVAIGLIMLGNIWQLFRPKPASDDIT